MILNERTFAAESVIWNVGDASQFACIVKTGSVVFVDDDWELSSGTFVGDVKAMYSGETHRTCLKASADSVLFLISKADLLEFFEANPGVHIFFLD